MTSTTERAGALNGWMRLVIGSILILLLAFVVVPLVQGLGPVREVRDAIDRAGIDASALFYTETEESFEAENAIRNALKYPPSEADADRPQGRASN
jgi:hypothetical protein